MKSLVLLFLLFLVIPTFAQEENPYKNLSMSESENEFQSLADIGVGIGLNYGGFMGFQLQYIPLKHLSIIGSAGYYLVGFGWQLGINGYLMPKVPSKSFRVYGTAMYGTNAAIVVENYDKYNKIYMGPTVGMGFEIRFGKSKRNGLNCDLLFPIRSSEFQDDMTTIKNDPFITDITEPLPFTIAIGYHFEIR